MKVYTDGDVGVHRHHFVHLRPPAAPSAKIGRVLARQLWRLGKHSAIYGRGAVVSRLIGVLLLPVVTRYLDRSDLGAVDTLVALSIVLVIVLRAGVSMAFFRFLCGASDPAGRVPVVRLCFGSPMAAAPPGRGLGLTPAEPISEFLFSTHA